MPALIVLLAAQFMVILDITVVNVALPSIQGSIGIEGDDLQWVITAYTLAFGSLLLLGGRAADLLGRRRIFVAGLAVFTAASAASGLADSATALIVARALQGVGAAMLSPAALSLVSTVFSEGAQRNRALAAWAAVGAAGGAFGVLVGGVLTENLGWEAIFLINLPVGLAAGVGALRVLPASPTADHRDLDIAGAVLASGSLVALIYGLVEANDAGWASAQTLGLFAVVLAGAAAFAVVESRHRAPLVPLKIFRRRATMVALVLMMLGMGTLLGGFYFSSLYLQQILGHSALRTGLEFLPVALAIVLAAHASGSLVARLGAKPLIIGGFVLGAAGAFWLSGLEPGGSYAADVLPGLFVLGLGIGLVSSGIVITAMSGAGEREAGLVSGLVATSHELGIALVLSVLAAIATAGVDAGAAGGAALAHAQTAGFADAFAAAALLSIAAALLALVGLRRGDVAPGPRPAFAH
jgi:EmrB/QacA subfamily drug resistance transporter